MWRLVHGISRSVREHFRGSFRSAPQTVCHEDEKETEILTKNIYHHSDVKKAAPNSICKQYTRNQNGKDQQWNKNYFHYNFWHQQCQHCKFIEAVGIGTALVLGCQVSQLLKFKVAQERRLHLNDKNHWTYYLYEAAFNQKWLSLTSNSILPQDKHNTKLKADVSWAKTPPQHEAETKIKQNVSKVSNHVYDHDDLSHIADLEGGLFQEKSKEKHLHTEIDQISGLTSKQKEYDIFEQFNTELADVCNKYHHTLYNEEGIRLAKCGKYSNAIKCWKKASSLGSNKAAFNLALCYETGKGTPVDLDKAAEFYAKALELGSAMAAYNLGLMYLNNQCSSKIDKTAEELLKVASTQGIPEAQTELGVIYSEKGENVAAAKLFDKAAEQKDSFAQYYLGLCYENGLGVEENACKAAELYSKASKQGHLQARYNLAYFFEHGLGGIPQNKKEALEMYKDCANKGISEAAKNADRLSMQTEIQKDLVKKEIDLIHLKISHSAPSLSSYPNIWDIDWDGMVKPVSLVKSTTMQNFITPKSFVNEHHGYCKNQKENVKFMLGGEDSCIDDLYTSSVNYFMLEGAFGDAFSLPKIKDCVMLKKQLHESPSIGNLSEFSTESDDSDFSIVFDNDINGIQFQNFETGRNICLNEERKSKANDNNTFSEFDVFGSTCSLDDFNENTQPKNLSTIAVT